MLYKVITRIKRDGQRFEKGSMVELDETVAASLIADGIIEDPKAAKVPPADDVSRRVHAVKSGKDTPSQPKTNDPNSNNLLGAGINLPEPEKKDGPQERSLEEMGRDELRAVAINEGIDPDQVNGLMTSKTTIRDLIIQKRAEVAAAAPNGDPVQTAAASTQADPSENL